MKSNLLKLFIGGIIIALITDCSEITDPDPAPASSPAANIVINELFRLPVDVYYSHWWIEIFNPTQKSINMYKWRITSSDSSLNFEFIKSSTDTTFYLDKGRWLILTNDKAKFNDFWNEAPQTTVHFLSETKSLPLLPESAEIVLTDSTGNAISVLRYGNYQPPSPDPFPDNRSFGTVPEWHSICRYADPHGAWDTGNSANDFFDESNPIVGYYSQLMHP